jgi:hypothetical protein
MAGAAALRRATTHRAAAVEAWLTPRSGHCFSVKWPGDHYRAVGRQPSGEAAWELADSVNTVPKVEAQLELAEMYETTSPLDAANLYQQIQKENPPPSPAGTIAASKLKGVK